MKKIKRLLTLFVAIAMTLCVFATAACDNSNNSTDDGEHVCQHVCPECGKCTDDVCDDPVCDDKCEGHDVIPGGHECEHVCPEEGCGKCTDEECEDPVCEDKCPGHGTETPDHECKDVCPECGGCLTDCEEEECSQKCPGNHEEPGEHECEDECPICGKCTTDCEKDECAEKCEGHVYTITLEVGEGTLPANAQTTYQTGKDGKISGYLPEPTSSKAHWSFDDWYDEDGNPVVEAETLFTKDTTITAKYLRDSGVWSGENADIWKIALVRNTGATGVIAEYWFGSASTKIKVEEGERLSLYLDGKLISHYAGGAVGVEGNKSSSQKSDYVTVTVSGDLQLYLKLYDHATDKENYVCEWLGATKVETGSEVPEGCAAVKFTFGGGAVVTIYLIDNTGKAVGKDDLSKFCLYTYNNEAFGTWANSASASYANNGILKEEMSASVALPSGWIFRWGSNYGQQTANIVDVFKSGKTYLVKLPSSTQGTATITELNLAD